MATVGSTIEILGLIPPPGPFAIPLPPIPVEPTLPAEAVALVLMAVAVATGTLVPARPKKTIEPPDPEANKRVLKLKAAFDVIDKVVNTDEILLALLKIIPAIIHARSGHQPQWVNWDQVTQDISETITQHLRFKLKTAMKLKVLQQKNARKNVTTKARDRIGHLHKALI